MATNFTPKKIRTGSYVPQIRVRTITLGTVTADVRVANGFGRRFDCAFGKLASKIGHPSFCTREQIVASIKALPGVEIVNMPAKV